jgi:hypothetical protein
MRAKFYKSVKANYVDSVLGLFGGLFSGALLAACILWVAAIAMPGKFSTLPQVQSLIELPRGVIASLETAAGVAPGSTGRTKYPVVSMVDVQIEDASGTLAAGSVLMQRRGRIDWK